MLPTTFPYWLAVAAVQESEPPSTSLPLFQTMTVVTLLLTGMGVALLGSIKLPLARRLAIDEARVGGMLAAFGFAIIPVIPTAGIVTDLVGKQMVVVVGSALMAASLGLLSSARRYGVAFVAVLLFSAAWASLINVINVVTPLAFPGGTASATNLGNVFFGLGAFLTPLALGFCLRRIGLTVALAALSLVALAPAVLAVGVDFAALSPASGAAQSVAQRGVPADPGVAALIADPAMWLFAFVLFFYGPIESAMAGWTTTYLGERGVRESVAAGLLSAFWLTFMFARLLTALTAKYWLVGNETRLILGLAVACVLVLSVLMLAKSRVVAIGVVLVAGLSFGPVFPTLMAQLLDHFPPQLRGRAVGMLFGVGGIGWTAIPMLMGAYARRTSVQRSFVVAIASAVGLTLVAASLNLYH